MCYTHCQCTMIRSVCLFPQVSFRIFLRWYVSAVLYDVLFLMCTVSAVLYGDAMPGTTMRTGTSYEHGELSQEALFEAIARMENQNHTMQTHGNPMANRSEHITLVIFATMLYAASNFLILAPIHALGCWC